MGLIVDELKFEKEGNNVSDVSVDCVGSGTSAAVQAEGKVDSVIML